MKVFLALAFSAVWCVQGSIAAAGKFCYNNTENCGPSHWDGTCKTGSQQSPINVKFTLKNAEDAIHDHLFANEEYLHSHAFEMHNNGHTAQAALRKDLTSRSTLSGKFLNATYVFSQLHFHWGSSDGSGSEHSFNDHFYDLELHLVHYRSDFANLSDAINSGKMGAVSVFGIFYKVYDDGEDGDHDEDRENGEPDEHDDDDNEGLKPILQAMRNTPKAGQNYRGEDLSLPALFPSKDFWLAQYEGSLTTPGCAQVVLWNVIKNINLISHDQMDQFRSLSDDRNEPLVDNYRPRQDLNDRNLTYYNISFNIEASRMTGNVSQKTIDIDNK